MATIMRTAVARAGSIRPRIASIASRAARPSASRVAAPLASAVGGAGFDVRGVRSILSAAQKDEYSTTKIEDIYGANCFNERAMKAYLPPKVFKEVQRRVAHHEEITAELAESFAAGLLRWAVERGATHYTHWFHPLTGRSAQKHDSFVDKSGDHVISAFSGKTLSIGEPDASSFPSGGLRETHEARGYTVWDPSSPCFIINHGESSTLYIPSVFFSWKGHAQDEKTPLLAASQALNREGLRLLAAVGDDSHSFLHTDAGVEQEFFLVDRDFVLKRPDIMQTGRSLIGAAPPKGQSLDDHYFGDLTERTMQLINDAEKEMWKLGIAQTTRHKEVAPGQYEIAPVFTPSSVASDNNVLVMETLHRVAHQHGMECLLHEKPFAGLNGSGKHNNWSIGTDKIGTVFNPGNVPQANRLFMLFLTATIRALDVHQDLVRIAVASCGNDHRLGANEAPPAIISAYLGDDIQEGVERFLVGDMSPSSSITDADDMGFSCMPHFKKDPTDRNRTSPFAFTGNKFEFRAVGSSHTPHRSCYILNTIVAEACGVLADEITARADGATGEALDNVVDEVLRETLKKHERIIFNGNSYSEEWHAEAEERGLLNLRSVPEALGHLNTEKNRKLFSEMGVFSEEVVEARANAWHEEYITRMVTEGNSFADLVNTRVLPAALKTQEQLAGAYNAAKEAGTASTAQKARLDKLSALIDTVIEGVDGMEGDIEAVHSNDDVNAAAHAARDLINTRMEETRVAVDALERICDSDTWTLPSYHEMLFTGQDYDVAPTGSAF